MIVICNLDTRVVFKESFDVRRKKEKIWRSVFKPQTSVSTPLGSDVCRFMKIKERKFMEKVPW